jgi:membrane fusion protein, multidrug efflux system
MTRDCVAIAICLIFFGCVTLRKVSTMRYRVFAALICAVVLAGCGKPEAKADADGPERSLLLSAEDLLTIESNTLAMGAVITGTVQPARRADLRAEVQAVVLQVLKENGDVVKRGDLLVRLDDAAIRDSLNSASEAVRASSQSYDQAERQLQRLKKLRESGMVTTQQLEDSEVRRNNAQSDLAGAQTRQAQARQQLQRTEARAPFDGVVSDKKVSPGDTAQVGKELLKVIDPASLRFEGFVSADRISTVKLGEKVSFRINGYGVEEFMGTVSRVSPAANPATRQVEVQVLFDEGRKPALAGLFAEGRIAAGGAALTIPAGSLVRESDKAFAWRVEGNNLKKVALALGERDSRRGDYVVKGGLSVGDKVLRAPAVTLKDGQAIKIAAVATSDKTEPPSSSATGELSKKGG